MGTEGPPGEGGAPEMGYRDAGVHDLGLPRAPVSVVNGNHLFLGDFERLLPVGGDDVRKIMEFLTFLHLRGQ